MKYIYISMWRIRDRQRKKGKRQEGLGLIKIGDQNLMQLYSSLRCGIHMLGFYE